MVDGSRSRSTAAPATASGWARRTTWSSGPCGARLVRDGSPVDTYDSLTRFWTLPARDRYTFKVVNCGDDIDRLRSVQLLKLRTHRVVGESLRLVRQTGYVDAAVVRTPDSGPPVIVSALARKTSKTWVPGAVVDLDTHQGRRFEPPGYQGGDGRPIAIPDMIVEPAQPLRFLHGYFDGVGGVDYAGLPSAPGSRRLLIVPQGRKIVRISVGALPRAQTTVEVGSGSLSTTVHRRPSQMTSATVTTTTQQWARLVYEDGNRLPLLQGRHVRLSHRPRWRGDDHPGTGSCASAGRHEPPAVRRRRRRGPRTTGARPAAPGPPDRPGPHRRHATGAVQPVAGRVDHRAVAVGRRPQLPAQGHGRHHGLRGEHGSGVEGDPGTVTRSSDRLVSRPVPRSRHPVAGAFATGRRPHAGRRRCPRRVPAVQHRRHHDRHRHRDRDARQTDPAPRGRRDVVRPPVTTP